MQRIFVYSILSVLHRVVRNVKIQIYISSDIFHFAILCDIRIACNALGKSSFINVLFFTDLQNKCLEWKAKMSNKWFLNARVN